jgi:hypothetical protein
MDQMAQNEIKRIWFHRVDEVTSLEALAALGEELINLDLPPAVAGAIRLKAIDKRRRLATTVAGSSEREKTANFAARYGMPAPDGRPLYAYRLTDTGFARLTADLIGKGMAYFESGYGAGLLALWAAEWFRREYSGGFFTWAELVKPLAGLVRAISTVGFGEGRMLE